MQPWQDETLEETRIRFKKFGQDKLEGDWRQRDHDREFSLKRWLACCDEGVLGMCMSEQYGGQGKSYGHAIAAIEGMCQGCHDTGFFFAMCSQISGIQLALAAAGSDDLKNRYLPALISGKHRACLGFSEESAGSDIYSIETTAKETDGGFLLNGSKSFTTNSLDSTTCLVFAKTAQNRTPFDFTAFMVDLDSDGMEHAEPFEKSALRTCSMGRLSMTNVFVPSENVIGEVGAGLNVVKSSIGWERLILMAMCIGPMSRVLENTIEWCKSRQQFGRSIGQYQQISSKVAEMVVCHRMSRQVVYDLAGRLTAANGSIGKFLQDVAITKLYVTENWIKFMIDATQIWGGRGVCKEWSIQQDMRDAMSSTIWAGTSETLRNTIAKMEGV